MKANEQAQERQLLCRLLFQVFYCGAAPVHRDPPQPVYRLRKIQCISQRTWNGLRVWLRQSLAKPEPARPLAPQGGRGAKGRARPRKTSPQKAIRVDSGVSPLVIPRRVK